MFTTDKDATRAIMGSLTDLGLTRNGNVKNQLYTVNHKQAFVAVCFEVLGDVPEWAYLHDIDKLVLYGITDKSTASGIHRKYAKHHYNNFTKPEHIDECIIDYECARYTKADKPLNAYDTIMKYTPEAYDIFADRLAEFGLNTPGVRLSDCRAFGSNRSRLLHELVNKTVNRMYDFYGMYIRFGPEKATNLWYSEENK